MTTSQLDSYRVPGPFTDPGRFSSLLGRIQEDAGSRPGDLARAVRGRLVHVFWREAYGLPPAPERAERETNLRRLAEKLERIAELAAEAGLEAAAPLPAEWKLIGNCRDHCLLFAALLRAAGLPARCRAGFATYFIPGHY